MMLPKPLSLEEIQAYVPSIGPVPEGDSPSFLVSDDPNLQ